MQSEHYTPIELKTNGELLVIGYSFQRNKGILIWNGSACDKPFVRELRVERLSRCGFSVPG